MTNNKLTIESLPRAVADLFVEVQQIKTLIKEGELGRSNHDDPINIDQAAEFLKIQKQTLYGYVSKKTVISHKKEGKLFFFKSELVQWIKSGNAKSFDVEEEASKMIKKRKDRKND